MPSWQTENVRTVGVEEELLLVDAESGRPRSVAGRILRQDASRREEREAESGPGGSLEHELQQQQVETGTPPRTLMGDIESDLKSWRQTAITLARRAGARVIASGTSPLPVEPRLFRDPRYERMAERFGITTNEHLTCACHVHVSVSSDDEGVGVIDRIRSWLHPLLALSANSPFWQGMDTGYASFRSQAMARWPSAGPTGVFDSVAAYRELVAGMVESGVLLDEGMVYFDARLSHRYPTVEIRVPDVCADTRDAVLVAALCRALVDTAAAEWAAGEPPLPVRTAMLRIASWKASRHGLDDDLLDPRDLRPRPAREVIEALVEHVRPALTANGDEALVDQQIDEVLARGNGASRQRATLERTGQLADVVAELARVTAGHDL